MTNQISGGNWDSHLKWNPSQLPAEKQEGIKKFNLTEKSEPSSGAKSAKRSVTVDQDIMKLLTETQNYYNPEKFVKEIKEKLKELVNELGEEIVEMLERVAEASAEQLITVGNELAQQKKAYEAGLAKLLEAYNSDLKKLQTDPTAGQAPSETIAHRTAQYHADMQQIKQEYTESTKTYLIDTFKKP